MKLVLCCWSLASNPVSSGELDRSPRWRRPTSKESCICDEKRKLRNWVRSQGKRAKFPYRWKKTLYSSDSIGDGKWSSQETASSHSSGAQRHDRRAGLLGKHCRRRFFAKRGTFGVARAVIITTEIEAARRIIYICSEHTKHFLQLLSR